MPFQIIRNDITKVKADAIVNTANPKPVYAPGTDAAIYQAAGAEDLLREREKIGEIEVGQARYTPAFALDAKYIIHTVGPGWIDGEHGEREAVRNCYENSLKLALELGCESIAFPLIATGVYGFPKADALKIAVAVFTEFLEKAEMQITLVVFDKDSFVLSGELFSDMESFIDENYVEERLSEEYCFGAAASRADAAPVMVGAAMKLPDSLPDSILEEEDLEEPEVRSRRRLFRRNAVQAAPKAMAMDMAMEAAPVADRSLDDVMAHVGESWQESLLRLIDEKGFTDVEIYKRANVDRKLFSKIRSNASYQPKKITAVAFALALKLNLDETKDLIGRAGYALSPSSKFDLIVEYFIEKEVYDIYVINLALFDHEQPTIGE